MLERVEGSTRIIGRHRDLPQSAGRKCCRHLTIESGSELPNLFRARSERAGRGTAESCASSVPHLLFGVEHGKSKRSVPSFCR